MRAFRLLLCAHLGLALAGSALGEDEASEPAGSFTAVEAEIFGRGVKVNGDSAKYREDYDDMLSGGGFGGRVTYERGEAGYGDIGASLLFVERGDTLDGSEVAFGFGEWGRYHLTGRWSGLQSFFDDSREGPFRGFPSSNGLGEELHTDRADVDVTGEFLWGDGGRVGLTYLHRGNEGDRSVLKGSVTETFSRYAFRAPASQDVDVRADAVDFDAVIPVAGVSIDLFGGYRSETNRLATIETNYTSSAVRDRITYGNDLHVDVAHGGLTVSATENPAVQGHAGYGLAYVESSGRASQMDAAASSPTRSATGLHVDSWTHVGHAGVIFRPLHDLAMRVSYSIRDRDRRASGSETRSDLTGAPAQPVANRSTKNALRHSPRASISYSGLPRTRLRASYRFDRIDRDFDISSIAGAGSLAIDRIQRTDEDVYRHQAKIVARTRLVRRVSAEVGYELLREDIDESVDELVNESTLGDRERHRDRAYAKLRLRAMRQTYLQLGGEYEFSEFERTDIVGDSSADVEGYRLHAQAHSQPLPGVSAQLGVSFVDLDWDVGEDGARNLSIFRDIEFEDRATVGSVAVSWAPTRELSLRGRYSAAAASGSLDNLSQRAHLDAGYQASRGVRFAGGYSFLGFDERLFSGDDFDGHLAWARVELTF